jgi:hypothetical protein
MIKLSLVVLVALCTCLGKERIASLLSATDPLSQSRLKDYEIADTQNPTVDVSGARFA